MWVGRSNSGAAKGRAPIAPINLSLKWSLLLRTYFGRTSQRCRQKCHATKVWSKARGKNCFFLWPPAPRSGAQRWILIRQVHNDVSLCCAENIHNISCLLLARTRSTLLAHCFCLKRLILMRPYSVRLLFWSFFLGFHTRKVFSGAQNTVSKFVSTLL